MVEAKLERYWDFAYQPKQLPPKDLIEQLRTLPEEF